MNRKMQIDRAIDASLALDRIKRNQKREQAARHRARVKVAKARTSGNELADALIARDILSPGILFVYRDASDRLRRESLAMNKRRALRVARPALDAAIERKSVNVDSFIRRSPAASVGAFPGEDESDIPLVGASGKLRGDDTPCHGTLCVSSVSFAAFDDDKQESAEILAWLECHVFRSDEGTLGFGSVTLRFSWLDFDDVRRFRVARPSEIPVEFRDELFGQLAATISGEFTLDETTVKLELFRFFLPGEYGERVGTLAHVPARDEIKASGACYGTRPKTLASKVRELARA